jgi:nucleotide-binding universal stress UspA family protein
MKFVACYENSAAGKAAVHVAQQHAGRWQADIDVISAVTRETPIKHARLKEMEDQLESDVRALLAESDASCAVHLLTDDIEAGEQIVRFASRTKADLIFLGIRKKSRVGKMLFGSNAQYVILNAPCPVVTVNAPPKHIK